MRHRAFAVFVAACTLGGGANAQRANAQRAKPQRAPAQRAPAVERRAILDVVRPAAAARVRQPVRIVVTRLNFAGDWAVLEGELVSEKGTALNWSRATECEPELDKRLWSVLRKTGTSWRVRELAVCAPEPPYWDPSFLPTTSAPCEVFAGLLSAGGDDLAVLCRRDRARRTRP